MKTDSLSALHVSGVHRKRSGRSLEGSLERDGQGAHTAGAAGGGVVGAGRHPHHALHPGRLSTQEVVLSLPRGLKHSNTRSTETHRGPGSKYQVLYVQNHKKEHFQCMQATRQV